MSKEGPRIQTEYISNKLDKSIVTEGVSKTAVGRLRLPTTGANPNVLFAMLQVRAEIPPREFAYNPSNKVSNLDTMDLSYSVEVVRGFLDYSPKKDSIDGSLSTDPQKQAEEVPSVRLVTTPLYEANVFGTRTEALIEGMNTYLNQEGERAVEVLALENTVFESHKIGKNFRTRFRNKKRQEIRGLNKIMELPYDPYAEAAEERAIQRMKKGDVDLLTASDAAEEAFEKEEEQLPGTQYFLAPDGIVVGTEWLGFVSDKITDKRYQYLEVKAKATGKKPETVFDAHLPYEMSLVTVYPTGTSEDAIEVVRVPLADTKFHVEGTRHALEIASDLNDRRNAEGESFFEDAKDVLAQGDIAGEAEKMEKDESLKRILQVYAETQNISSIAIHSSKRKALHDIWQGIQSDWEGQIAETTEQILADTESADRNKRQRARQQAEREILSKVSYLADVEITDTNRIGEEILTARMLDAAGFRERVEKYERVENVSSNQQNGNEG